jgi:hypothetical protein
MARRKNRHKIPTPTVQGDDSYVIVTLPSVGSVKGIVSLTEQPIEAFDETSQILTAHVHEWNWVDDDEKQLPAPVDDPSVIDLLTIEEYRLLVRLLLGAEETRKN